MIARLPASNMEAKMGKVKRAMFMGSWEITSQAMCKSDTERMQTPFMVLSRPTSLYNLLSKHVYLDIRYACPQDGSEQRMLPSPKRVSRKNEGITTLP